MKQISIFDALYPKFKIDKPIRLIELFAGYGSQALAFDYLNIPYENYQVCEFNQTSIDAYNQLHETNFNVTNIQEISLKPIDYNFCNIMTYSFPCQNISIAGRREGMEEGSNTNSSLLWEVKRLLEETKNLPQILLMENVKTVLKAKGWREWVNFLHSKGYSNYIKVLKASDYGVPQGRERCFMVSILGDYSYSFPSPIRLKSNVHEYLEKDINEKEWYVTDKMLAYLTDMTNRNGFIRGKGFKTINKGTRIARTINTHGGSSVCDNFIKCENGRIRNMTPKESFRLMGLRDEDIEKIKAPKTQLYTLAGNSIVVQVLMAIFKELL